MKITTYFLLILLTIGCNTPEKIQLDKPVYNRILSDQFLKLFKAEPASNTPFKTLSIELEEGNHAELKVKEVGMVAGDYSNEVNHFRMILIDEDNNGLFNDYGIDRFGITAFENDSVFTHLGNNFVAIQPEISVYFTNTKLLFSFEVDGSQVKVTPSEEVVHDIYFADFLPDTELKSNDGLTTDLHKVAGGKLSFLEYATGTCTYKHRINLEGTVSDVNVIQLTDEGNSSMNIYNAYSFSSQFLDFFNVGLPDGIVYGEDGRLLKIHVQEH